MSDLRALQDAAERINDRARKEHDRWKAGQIAVVTKALLPYVEYGPQRGYAAEDAIDAAAAYEREHGPEPFNPDAPRRTT